MSSKSRKSINNSKNGVTILNESIKIPVPGKTNETTTQAKTNDIQVVTMRNPESSSSKQTKMDHYVLKTMKNERDPVSEENDDISIVLVGDDEESQDEFLDNSQGDVTEELHLSDEENENKKNDNSKEIVEHVCGKCFKTFRRITGFKKHFDFCRIDSDYHIRKAEMLKNLKKIEKDAMTMENKDICFCCGESYDTYHLGHINCPDCPKSFKTQSSYERHIFITHSEKDDYPCSICNAKMRSQKLLELHEDQHKNRGKPFACKVCGKEFTRNYHLIRHQKYSSCSNDTTATTSCKVCNKVFHRLDNLRVHLKQHLGTHVTKNREYMCPICKSCFYSLSTLNIHTRTHTGEKPFECDLCDKKFAVLVALKKHRRYHTGEKPYTCSVCNQCFAVKEVLNRHMKRHTGDKQHKCEECGKAFIQATQLRIHLNTHIRPFACDMCEEKFKTQKGLDRHAKVHKRKNRPGIRCDICKIYFGTYEEKAAHMQNGQHIPAPNVAKPKRKSKADQRTDCPVCGEVFPVPSALKFHILKVHDENSKDFVTDQPNSSEKIENESPTVHKEAGSRTKTRRSKDNPTNVEMEPPKKVYKIEKDSDEGLMILPDDEENQNSGILTYIDPLNNKKLLPMSININDANHDNGVVVQECIINDPPNNNNNNADTIILNDEHFTIIPLDTYTTVDTRNTNIVTTSPIQQSRDYLQNSKNRASSRLNKEQRIALRDSLVAAITEADNDAADSDDDNKLTEDDIRLTENVKKLLDMLVDSETLEKFGWPNASEEQTLCRVIENCGHDLSKDAHDYLELDFGTRMREYVKLLFTVVIPNDSIQELLNNYQIDEVIEFVLGNEEEEDDEEEIKPKKEKNFS